MEHTSNRQFIQMRELLEQLFQTQSDLAVGSISRSQAWRGARPLAGVLMLPNGLSGA
jgi:hypothetical protein